MPIHDAAYNGSPCALQVLASSAISLAKFAALVSMITWRRRASAARGIVRRLTITTSVHEPAASKARTSPDPTCPVPPTTKTRKPMLCLSPSHIAGGIFKRDSVAAYYPDRSQSHLSVSGMVPMAIDRHLRAAVSGNTARPMLRSTIRQMVSNPLLLDQFVGRDENGVGHRKTKCLRG